jgi:hypothetical protein
MVGAMSSAAAEPCLPSRTPPHPRRIVSHPRETPRVPLEETWRSDGPCSVARRPLEQTLLRSRACVGGMVLLAQSAAPKLGPT